MERITKNILYYSIIKKMEDKSNVEEQVEWNMAQLINMEIARLTEIINVSFMNGDYARAIKGIMAKRMTAGFVLNDSERKQVETYEKELRSLIQRLPFKNSFSNKAIQEGLKAEFFVLRLFPKYNELVQDLLDKYGFMGGRKKDSKIMSMGAKKND